jgi:hypothetical protein
MVDSLGKEPKEEYHSLMLLTKESMKHILDVMRSYVEKNLQDLREGNHDEALIMKQHKLHFTAWLNDLNLLVGETFYTKEKDSTS